MNLIVAADKNWGIGRQNKLLVSIPGDMRFFKEKTTGRTVILGRRTLESFPGGKPLKDRNNIVISFDQRYETEGALVVHSMEEALRAVKAYPSQEVYVAGGASIYSQFLPHCDTAYVTRIDFSYEADTFFPNLDADPEWKLCERSEEQTCYDLVYHFCTYRRTGA